MKLIKWAYSKRYNIRATFDKFPKSNVIFRVINQFYFVYIVNWSKEDPPVTRTDLETMEFLLNKEMGTADYYRMRRSNRRNEYNNGGLEMKRAMIIANPSSGREEAENYIRKINGQLERKQYSTDIRLTKKEGDATRFAEEACSEKYEVVISMGGDGTLHEIVNGMAEKEHRPALGIIPLGTVNDFARAANIPLGAEEAIEVLVNGEQIYTDIGKINSRYFLNILALGDIAEVTAEVSAEKKTALGSFAYLLEGLKTLTGKNPFPLSINSQELVWEGEALLFLATLTNSVGGFEKIAPEAETDDGKFHCFIFKEVSLPKLVRMVRAILKGQLKEDQDVIHFCTDKLEIHSQDRLKSNIDGEIGDEVPLRLEVLKQHVKVIRPE